MWKAIEWQSASFSVSISCLPFSNHLSSPSSVLICPHHFIAKVYLIMHSVRLRSIICGDKLTLGDAFTSSQADGGGRARTWHALRKVEEERWTVLVAQHLRFLLTLLRFLSLHRAQRYWINFPLSFSAQSDVAEDYDVGRFRCPSPSGSCSFLHAFCRFIDA